jgi:hypothetical protein
MLPKSEPIDGALVALVLFIVLVANASKLPNAFNRDVSVTQQRT